MNENIAKMLSLLAQDEEAQKKLAATRDPDEAYSIVTEISGGYTKEEFMETMRAIDASVNQDLTSEDLAKNAGGVKEEALIASGTVAGSAAVTAITVVTLLDAGVVGAVVTAATGAIGGAASAAM